MTSVRLGDPLLQQVVAFVRAHGPSEDTVGELRRRHAGVHFTWCLDDDITVNARPVVQAPTFNVYLVNSSAHCSILTNDLDAASGIVVAEVLPD
jgi:hypothetical protein